MTPSLFREERLSSSDSDLKRSVLFHVFVCLHRTAYHSIKHIFGGKALLVAIAALVAIEMILVRTLFSPTWDASQVAIRKIQPKLSIRKSKEVDSDGTALRCETFVPTRYNFITYTGILFPI